MRKPTKTVLVTGASSGFGQLIALRLAQSGHTVFASMRDPQRSDPLLSDARRRNCLKNIHVLALDVTKPETIRTAVEQIMERSGVLDVLVNNAGFGMGGFFEDLSPQDWAAQFDVNFFGVLNVTREVIAIMRPRRSGTIINISSMAAFRGTPCFSAYCSSKWALEGFSECLYMELEPFKIRVALVEPGSYRTNIFESNARYASGFDNPNSPYSETNRRLKSMVLEMILKNRRNPEEVAAMVQDIVNSKYPPFRNIVGPGQYLRRLASHLIPFELYSGIVNLALGR